MDTLHPIWAQRFSILSHTLWLFDEDEDSMYIHFRVMDRDEISADDFLGEVKVPFKHITLNRTLYLELSSVTKKKKAWAWFTMPQFDSESLDRDQKPYLVIRLHVRGVRIHIPQTSLYHSLVTEILNSHFTGTRCRDKHFVTTQDGYSKR